MMLRSSHHIYIHQGTLDYEVNGDVKKGSWRQEIIKRISLHPIRRIARKASSVNRDNRQFAEYFSNVERVPWQDLYA
ncbi:hypothetical protein NQ314_017588 [Rhamnusium bicolor]|uniref:Uncharacterized protein n=1 Tax=Rhamnusium bicolor TaxID=1586634 RepID=A0AAV8WSG6_9CUCU|nr:hypothetical protein NQ314_017588 [Rhamnusium bicolor]